MAKSGWTDEDEKALLGLLQKKWHSENSGSGYAAGSSILTPLESQGAMTDGSKRLREALDDDEFDVISSAAEPLSAQLPVMPIPIFPGIADKVLDQLTADLVPEGMSFRDWSRTKFAFGKLPMRAKHTVRYMSMMRWPDIANGVCVTWETRVRVQSQRIGILFSARARLWRTLERLESQRVASLELQCRGSWVIESIFIDAKARKRL